MCSWEGLLDFENEEYVVFYLLSAQGPASSLDCPAIFFLEYRSTENELQLFAPGPIYLLPHFEPRRGLLPAPSLPRF